MQFFTVALAAQQQNIGISGVVRDELNNEPLAGATVQLKGTTRQVVTDNNGNFSFVTGQKLPATVEVTFVGYDSKEFEVTTKAPVVIPLKGANSSLNELTVIGYTQTKRNARNGAVTTVTAANFSKVNYTSVLEKLQGQVPGLMIQNNSGVPGTSVLVRLRGATSITAGNDPLYVVDGIFINTDNLQNLGRGLGGQVPNFLADLNPDDIESMSVLKDANATAVYGARGANSVIHEKNA